MTTTPARRTMSGRDWAALAAAFVGAFLAGLALQGEFSSLKVVLLIVGIILIVLAAAAAFVEWRERDAELQERRDWAAFERSLEDGVRFDVPEDLGYAAELPVLLDDMAESGEPSDGQARHAIVGEQGPIHWCAFQHQRPGGTSTVGMVGLHPDRATDVYPRLRVRVKDAGGSSFDERYDVMCPEPGFAEQALPDDVRAELMRLEPFDWRLVGNQIVTSLDAPSSPEQQVGFIEQRVLPLARVAERIPLDS